MQPAGVGLGAISHALWTLLGLLPDALGGRLRVIRLLLPAWLDRLELTGTRVGGALLDLRFERDDGGRVTVRPSICAGEMAVEQTGRLLTGFR